MRRAVNLVPKMAIAIGLVLGGTRTASAACDRSINTIEQAVWDAHGGFSFGGAGWNFRTWFDDVYAIDHDWDARGWWSPDILNYEYAKMENAAFLITYGMADDRSYSFHSSDDYQGVPNRFGNSYKDRLYHSVSEDPGLASQFVTHFLGPNEIQSGCYMFSTNPADRVAIWVHEGWHGWQYKYGFHPDHGHYPCSSGWCDYFYWHQIGAYPFGYMWLGDEAPFRDYRNPGHHHSPIQVQLEYSCDLAERHWGWVPLSAELAAKDEADTLAVNKFINGPAFYCGDPRPIPPPIDPPPIDPPPPLPCYCLDGTLWDCDRLWACVPM